MFNDIPRLKTMALDREVNRLAPGTNFANINLLSWIKNMLFLFSFFELLDNVITLNSNELAPQVSSFNDFLRTLRSNKGIID